MVKVDSSSSTFFSYKVIAITLTQFTATISELRASHEITDLNISTVMCINTYTVHCLLLIFWQTFLSKLFRALMIAALAWWRSISSTGHWVNNQSGPFFHHYHPHTHGCAHTSTHTAHVYSPTNYYSYCSWILEPQPEKKNNYCFYKCNVSINSAIVVIIYKGSNGEIYWISFVCLKYKSILIIKSISKSAEWGDVCMHWRAHALVVNNQV